jgi:hypothetical protein
MTEKKYIIRDIDSSNLHEIVPEREEIIISATFYNKLSRISSSYQTHAMVTENGVYRGDFLWENHLAPYYTDWAEMAVKDKLIKGEGKLFINEPEASQELLELNDNFIEICEGLKAERDKYWENKFPDKKQRLQEIEKYAREINLKGKDILWALIDGIKDLNFRNIIPKDEDVIFRSIFSCNFISTGPPLFWSTPVLATKKGVVYYDGKIKYAGWKQANIKRGGIYIKKGTKAWLLKPIWFKRHETKEQFNNRSRVYLDNLRKIQQEGKLYWKKEFTGNYKDEIERINDEFWEKFDNDKI